MPTVSFYSFKGGVGRTFVATECAAQIARQGLRVCYWDLDLEAPALHRHSQIDPGHGFPWGTLDLFERADEQGVVKGSLIDRALVRVAVTDGGDDAASFHVLFAAGSEAFGDERGGDEAPTATSYAERYWAIDWKAEYASNRATNVFLTIADHLASQFDLVIIDARTGLTDVGYLATRVLADAVVVVFGLSDQNLEGLRRAYDAIVRRQGAQAPPPVRLVANLVPDDISRASNPRLADAYEAQMHRLSALSLTPDHELPLVPARLVDDLVPSLRGGARDEAMPFEALAEWVLDQVPSRSPARQSPSVSAHVSPLARSLSEAFEADVAELLRHAGWNVDPPEPDHDTAADLVARRADALSPAPLLVGCHAGARVGREHVGLIAAAVDRYEREEGRRSSGALVTARRPGAATADAAEKVGVTVLTVDDLVEQVLPAEPLLAHLAEQARTWRLTRTLITRHGHAGEHDRVAPVAALVDEWLEGGPPALLVLGDGGTGKSTELRRITELLTDRWTKSSDAKGSPLPLPIDINAIEPGNDLTTVLARTMWAIWQSTDVEALRYLWTSGRILIVVDGLDERAPDSDCRWLRELIEGEGKALLSSRPDPILTSLPAARVSILTLLPVHRDDASDYLITSLGPARGESLLRWFRTDPQGGPLMLSPLILEMLAATAGRVGSETGDLDAGSHGLLDSVIGLAVNTWIADFDSVPTELAPRVLAELALARWQAPESPSADVLARALRASAVEGVDLAPVLARCPLLVAEGSRYRFLHEVIEHYFLAHALGAAAVERRWSTFDGARVPQGIRPGLARWSSDDPDRARVALKRAVAEVSSGSQLISRRLATNLVIFVHAADPALEIRRAALANADVSHLDLTGIRLPSADLAWADLEGALLRDADLRGVNLTGADLTGASLRGADLSGARLVGTVLTRTDLRDAELEGAVIHSATLDDAAVIAKEEWR